MINIFRGNTRRWFVIAVTSLLLAGSIVLISSRSEKDNRGNDRAEVNNNKVLFNESIPSPPENEFSGIVYKGYILKNLRENEWGWYIPALANELDIEMVVEEDKNDIYSKWEIPVNFYLKRGDVTLSFKGDIDKLDDVYLNAPHMATITYKVFKENRELVLKKQPLTYRKGGPYIDLIELLEALEIKYFTDGSTIYLDTGGKTEILGKVLDSRSVELSSKETVNLKLIYNYRSSNDPGYKDIELLINGKKDTGVKVFDEFSRGSSEYYRYGTVEYLNYSGEDLVQVILGNDTAVYKYEKGKLFPLFTRDDYIQYLGGSLVLKTGENGMSVFIDRVNGFRKEFELKDVKPNSIFDVNIRSFGRIETDILGKQLKMVAVAGAVCNGRVFFSVQIEFIYDGNAFIPLKIVSIDEARYDQDKTGEKLIDSMEEYKRFEYHLKEAANKLPKFRGTVSEVAYSKTPRIEIPEDKWQKAKETLASKYEDVGIKDKINDLKVSDFNFMESWRGTLDGTRFQLDIYASGYPHLLIVEEYGGEKRISLSSDWPLSAFVFYEDSVWLVISSKGIGKSFNIATGEFEEKYPYTVFDNLFGKAIERFDDINKIDCSKHVTISGNKLELIRTDRFTFVVE